MIKLITSLVAFFWTINLSNGDDFCGIRNNSFQDGERIMFTVFYNALGIYVNAGSATFSVAQERLNNKEVYHITGIGTSNSSYDWIF